jgi:hypothetical protein
LLPFSSQEKVEDAPTGVGRHEKCSVGGDEFTDVAFGEDLTPLSPLLGGEGIYMNDISF